MKHLNSLYICHLLKFDSCIMANYNRIKELLAKKGQRNVDLAKHLKIDPRQVSKWCRNISQPRCKTLFKISDFLEMEAGELLTLKKDLRTIATKKKKKL